MYNHLMTSQDSTWRLAIAGLHEMSAGMVCPDEVNIKSVVSVTASQSRWPVSLHVQKTQKRERGVHAPDHSLGISNEMSWKHALAVFYDLGKASIRLEQTSVNTVVNACRSTDAWKFALYLLRERCDLIGFNSALSCTQKSSLWTAVLQMVNNASTARLFPDDYTASTLLHACEQRWQLALCFVDWPSPNPSLISVNAAIDACATALQWQASLQLFDNMTRWRYLREHGMSGSSEGCCDFQQHALMRVELSVG